MRSVITLLVFGMCVFVASSSGLVFSIGAENVWFESLNRPSFAPPNWLFGPVWTMLYILIAISAWTLVMSSENRNNNLWGVAISLWALQMCLNVIWSPIFFTAQAIDVALYYIVALWITILLYILTAWRIDRISGGLFIPYFVWITFAMMLNFSYAQLN